MRDEGDDVALKLLHTADWHLGLPLRQFPDAARKKLQRARFDVLDDIFGAADRYGVDAVLCAGDLFDRPDPERDVWEAALEKLRRTSRGRPIFLLPGNHDPIVPGSLWMPEHPFRRGLPSHAQVVDRSGFEAPLTGEAVLLAHPCQAKASSDDPTLALPPRAPGDERIRIGMVHGMTFDLPGHEGIFPIGRGAAARLGLDYLALGDTHGFRNVADEGEPPTIYPGAPEGTKFGEQLPGQVAHVIVKRSRRVRCEPVPVGRWRWRKEQVDALDGLRALAAEPLDTTALHLTVSGVFTPAEHDEAKRLLRQLEGSDYASGRVGALVLAAGDMRLDARDISQVFEGMPEDIRAAVRILEEQRSNGDRETSKVAERALLRLYRTAREVSP